MELDDMKCDPDFRGETDEADDAPYAFTNEDEAQVNKEEMDLEMKPIAAKTSEDRARRTFEDTIMVDTEDQGDTGMANTTNSCVRSEARNPMSSKAGRQNAVGQSRPNRCNKQRAAKVGLLDVAIKQTRLLSLYVNQTVRCRA
ncbi:hypothetical protein PC128_g12753 [Phytophthora cactorum]|nr:hypothetical protein PC128_g12753 [Phytophthora cactorum]